MKWGHQDFFIHLCWLIPLLAMLLWLERKKIKALAKLASPVHWPGLIPHRLDAYARVRGLLWISAVVFLVIAIARPQWGFHWEEVHRSGMDLIVVLDTSRSMMAPDFKPNRLQQAKWALSDFVKKLSGDRIGLVAFAGTSFLQCPLTVDYAAFLMSLNDVYAGIIPRGGTAIEQALKTAIQSFEKSRESDHAIILITDGEDHEGDPLSLLPELKKNNILVYALGIGTLEGELIPEAAETGKAGFVKDGEGRVIKTALKEDMLEKLALRTGGAYVRALPGNSGLDLVMDQHLASLRRSESSSRMVKTYEDRAGWFLGLAFLLLASEAALLRRRGRRMEDVA